ncbi:MAG: PAS domain S-box protein [Candidatus Binatus sp.]
MTLVMGDGDNTEWVSSILRAASIAIIAFQIGYTVLDGVEYPQTFTRTLPLHIASITLGLVAVVATLSPRAMRNWRAIALAICSSILAITAWIGAINSDGDALVASILLSFLGSGALIPWNPRWQAAFNVSGALALLGYSMQTADPNPRIAISWMMLLSAALLSQLSAVLGTRYRRKLAEQLAALAENHRLLGREMDLRAETASALERDHVRLQASESMLRKVFEASPDNIAINRLSDGRFIAVNDNYRVAGYTRADVLGANVIALGTWKHKEEIARFLESLRRTGRVRNMEIIQRRKDGAVDETHLISASLIEVNGEPCVISMLRDITEIKRVETSLRASHAALRKIFDATLDIIVVTRLSDGSYIDFNRQFERIGCRQQDPDDSRKGQRKIWASAEQHQELRDRIMADGVVRNMEVDFLLPDGGLMPALLSAVRVELDGEDCLVKMIRDLTAAKEASRKVEENAKAVRDIFAVSPDAISVNRVSDGKFVAFNEEFLSLTGYTREQAMSSSALELEVWTDPADRMRLAAALAQNGTVRNLEIEFQISNGTRVPTLISASMIELGSELCIVAYIRDITGRKRNERDLLSAREELSRQVKALSASEETFRKLFDANLDSMALTGVDGNYIDVNQEFIRATGFSRDETIGHHFTELNMWIHPDEMIAFADQLFRTNEVRNLEVAIRRKDGSERPVLISAVNLELHGQLCCLTISREISDLKTTQRELVGAREAALAASRAKSEFLSSMSHEIRTPMNAILGMADLLMETELGDEQRRYLSTVISNSHALLQLIDSILDLARVESGRISLEAVEFDPKEVTEKALETLAIRAHEKGLELMVRFAPEVPELALGDPFRLGQILINLVGNAIKFTQHGQVLVLVEPDRNSTIAGGLKFTVTDTGIGIPADKLPLLFNAFTQADSSTSRKYGGSGLGLAIVSRLVALMHGKVAVASEPGIGSAFSFTAQFGTANTRTAPSGPSKPAFGDVTILLVDDNSDSRSILSELLTAQGATVTQASSGTEVLGKLRRDVSLGSCFQIVLLDGTMPAPGGFDIATHLMSGAPGRPQIVMMLGTNDLTSELGRLRAIGVDNYIVKPVRRAELFAAVARACAGVHVEPHGDRFASPAIAPVSTSSAILDQPLQILIADDSHDNRALIRAYLKKTPYRLEEAEDGQQAIDKFIAGKFDLVLMDIQMPIVDGYEATTRIRGWERANNRRRTPIVALTASALEEAVHRAKAAGCDAHVTKPVKKFTLLDAIRNAIEANPLDDERAELTNLKEETCPTG